MRTWQRTVDIPTLAIWLALVGAGLVAIYSTTLGPASEFMFDSVRNSFTRQLGWVGICLVGSGIALTLPVRFYQNVAYPAYALTIVLLIVTIMVGQEINGARSWLRIGGLQLQVSELAKIGTILAVASLLSSRQAIHSSVRYGLVAVALILLPAILIVLQQDAGTALVFFALIPVMLFWSGFPFATVLLIVSPAIAGYLAVVSMPLALGFAVLFSVAIYLRTRERYMGVMSLLFTGGTAAVVTFALTRIFTPYQVARILSFTNPEAEEYRHTVGYNLVQSIMAIGSGGLTGKGFMQGTQTQGAYVPEQSTDFVFSVIGEEFGFAGAGIVLLLFAGLLGRLIYLGIQMKHPFGIMIAGGAVGLFLTHIFVNVGMATGILPVIGIPLPFISYGGSALLANTALVAILLNLYMRRDEFSIYGY